MALLLYTDFDILVSVPAGQRWLEIGRHSETRLPPELLF